MRRLREVMPKPSCPHGYTQDDLRAYLGPQGYHEFREWMTGQTELLCDGWSFHYHRGPCFEEDASVPMGSPGWPRKIPVPVHEQYSDHTWLCDYAGGGEKVESACSARPHGLVTYVSDVERFLMGLPIID